MSLQQFARSTSQPLRGPQWHHTPRRLVHSPPQRPKPLVYPKDFHSLLPVLLACSNLQLPRGPWSAFKRHMVFSRMSDNSLKDREYVAPFYLDDRVTWPNPVGFLRPVVAKALLRDDQEQCNSEAGSPWVVSRSRGEAVSVSFAPEINRLGRSAREAAMKRLLEKWRADGLFCDILNGWSDELFPIYDWPSSKVYVPGIVDPIAFAIERAALPLFSFPNFGSLMIGYFYSPSDGEIRFWIPRRSSSKRTWPGYLDVTVGGGLDATSSPLSTIVRECAEEASLPQDFVSNHIVSAGVLPFPNRSLQGWILPGLYYLYDLHLPPDIVPQVNEADGEVEAFETMDSATVFNMLLEGRFKPSSAMALVNFLIRHGYVSEENEPRYAELCLRLHRSMPLSKIWR